MRDTFREFRSTAPALMIAWTSPPKLSWVELDSGTSGNTRPAPPLLAIGPRRLSESARGTHKLWRELNHAN